MAYALVVSLEQTLEPFVGSARSKFPNLNLLLGLIHNQLCYVKSFFEKAISLEDSNNVEEVEREIKDVVQNARDLIESRLSDLFRGGVESWISGFYPELVKVNAKLASLVKELKAMEDHLTGGHQPPAGFGSRKENTVGVGDAAASSSIIDLGRNDVIVGMEDEVLMLKDRLLPDPRDLKVICIVGMGGIGKTTLAKQVYLDPITIEHFDVRLFVEIGVEYELEEVLLRLIGQLGSVEGEVVAAGEILGGYLYKYLKHRRYLIVLDDLWDIDVWDQLRLFFPNDPNGSRIILTTRISNMARDVCSTHDNVVEKQFLDNEKSWELLWRMALSFEEGCPSELENVGKSIAQNLGGLPLAVVTIGKFLSRSPRTLESWSAVAQNIHSSIWESDVPAFLSLSYTQLPQHLKACFLYLGLFPPNSRISTALLIKLWVAEGFVEEEGGYNRSSLEEKAREYLHDLVGRSLVIIDELRSSGGIKTCRVHQLLQDLCVSEAQQQKLFHIVKEGIESFTESTKDLRRLGIYGDVILGSQESVSGRDRFGNTSHRGDSWTDFVAIFRKIMRRTFVGGANPPFASDIRSLVFICPQSEEALEVNLGFRWLRLRVLHALSFRFREFPDGVLKLVRLKYLAITCDGELPSSISRLRNLEFLIIHRSQSINSHMFLPLEIWKLQQLSHLECMGFDLPDPSTAAAMAHDNVVHLRKLVTLLGVSARTCTESVLARMPNLIKLGIWFDPTKPKVETSCFGAVGSCLHRLESFKCVGTVMNRGLGSEAAFSLNRLLPYGLIKLSLGGCGFVWSEHMAIFSQLPNLQVLKLRRHAFCGPVWVTIWGDFVRLKLLVLEDLDLCTWVVESWHFPFLEQLHIRRCSNLTMIPFEIGDTPTLQVIVLDECSNNVIESARFIKGQQQEYGETLQIRIHSSPHGKAKQTTSYNATSVALDHSTADISRSKEEFAMTASPDSTSETELKPAPAQPLTNEKDNEVPVPKPISLLEEDEVATSRDATSVAFAQSTAADVSLSLESLDTKVKLAPAPAQCLSNDLLPFKTISMLQEDEESGEFWVYATISSLEKIGAWSYLACRRCFSRLKHDDDAFVCHECNNYDIRGRLRYNLTLGVSDETGEATFRLWDSEFLKFIAETAYELNQVGELDELPMEIESLGDKKALFKVLVREEHTKKFTGSYSVTEVIIDLDKFCETYSENQIASEG